MTETIQRRQRRGISSSPIPTAAAPDVPTGVSAPQLTEMLQLQHLRDIVRTRQFRLIGRLSRVQVVRPEGSKILDFRKEGPVLAFAVGSEQIVVTTPWPGIPSKWDDTDQFCSQCLAECDVCGATGKKVCEGFQCGGSGKVPLPMVMCKADGCLVATKQINPVCTQCHGSGYLIAMGDCKMCGGSGQMTCPVCRGTKKRPTGIQGGSYNHRLPACSGCGGLKFAHTEIPQPLSDYLAARIGAMVALGPIVRFVVESIGGEGTPPKVFDVVADSNGQHMVILLEHEQPGAAMFMIGGTLNFVTRT